jgi:hypothetical protein
MGPMDSRIGAVLEDVKCLLGFLDAQKHVVLGFDKDVESAPRTLHGTWFGVWPSNHAYLPDSSAEFWGDIFSERMDYIKNSGGSIVFVAVTTEYWSKEILTGAYEAYKLAKQEAIATVTSLTMSSSPSSPLRSSQKSLPQRTYEFFRKRHEDFRSMTMFELMYCLDNSDLPKFRIAATEDIQQAILGTEGELRELFQKRVELVILP